MDGQLNCAKTIVYVLCSGDGYGHDSIEDVTFSDKKAIEWAAKDGHYIESFEKTLNLSDGEG